MTPPSAAASRANRLTRRLPGRFTLLLMVLLGLILVPPFLEPYAPARIVLPIFASAMIILGLNVYPHNRPEEFAVGCALAILSLGGRWLLMFYAARPILIAVSFGWFLFLTVTVVVIVRDVLTAREISYDTISGAACGYLVFGMAAAAVYAMIEIIYPGSFVTRGAAAIPIHGDRIQGDIEYFLYFSLVTLASVGFGDVVPVTPPAQMFAAIEGITGQFYLAVLIARLVSIHSSRWGND